LLLPAALIHGWQARDRRAERGLVLAWIASVLVLFSLASGRLEHYSLPALPAVALLVGDLVAETAAGRSRVSRRWLVVPPAARARVEPLFSWRPFARAIDDGTTIFFRASDEYQLCGGLDYYTGRYVALLAPPGWSPPTFLAGRTERLFVPRTELERAWRGGNA